MLQNFSQEEFDRKNKLPIPEYEDDELQHDIGGAIAHLLMKQFNIDGSRFDPVANAVFGCLEKLGFTDNFRKKCCVRPDGVRPDIYAELEQLNNGERIDLVFKKLEYGSLKAFLENAMPHFETALIAAGFDIQVSEAARRLLEEVV